MVACSVSLRVASLCQITSSTALSRPHAVGMCVLCVIYCACIADVPERFVIDAKTVRYRGGASLAERPITGGVAADVSSGAASPVTAAGAGTGHTLGQGFFGKVTSMAWNGSPVAVKEVSGNSLDAASIGTYTNCAGTVRLSLYRDSCDSPMGSLRVIWFDQRTSWRS